MLSKDGPDEKRDSQLPLYHIVIGLWDTVSVDYIESLRPDELGNNIYMIIVIQSTTSHSYVCPPAEARRLC